MKKLLTSLLAAAVLAMALAACALQGAAPSAAPGETALPGASGAGFTAQYCLEKLNEASDMVLERESIPADCLRYLPEEVKALAEEYNQQTGFMRVTYTQRAKAIADSLFYETKSDPGNYDQSALYYEWVGRIARYALYENAGELCRNDPYLAYPLAVEAGGSYGMWPEFLHGHESEDDQRFQDYLGLVDRLLDAMDAARENAGKD